MPTDELIAVLLVSVLASVTQTVAGFGFALLAVPLMSLAVDTPTAVLIAGVLGFINNVAQFSGDWSDADRPVARRLILGAFAGMPVGLVVLIAVDENVLRFTLGVAVAMFTVALARRAGFGRASSATDWIAGVTSGILNTSLSTNGPPLVIALQARRLGPAAFRATMSIVFVASGVVGLLLFTVSGRFSESSLIGSAAGLPALVVGGLLGRRLRPHVDADRFRPLVLTLLAISAIAAIAASVSAWA